MSTAVKTKNPENILSKYEPCFKNTFTILKSAKKGMKPEAVFDFIFISDLSNDKVEVALNKSMKTFQNYKDKKMILDVVTGEKLLKLFALYSKGAEVFGSVDAFSEWLSKPAFGIGNEIPENIMDTMSGIELINEELVRIEFGDLA